MTDPLEAQALELIGLAEKATAGPWQMNGARGKLIHARGTIVYHDVGPDGDSVAGVWFDEQSGLGFHDAKFIAHARNHAPAIARAYLEARAEIERLRKALEFYSNPEIYKPHPHGIGFDRRDLSFHARAALHPQPDTTSEVM